MASKGFFSTNNYGVYFYLIGSLIFFYQTMYANKVSFMHSGAILFLFTIFSLFIVYVVQPKFSS
tara:strand:+ start:284 stop:475 length:192 start_codon:yes stop_codon:yes gene_type:complete